MHTNSNLLFEVSIVVDIDNDQVEIIFDCEPIFDVPHCWSQSTAGQK